MKCFDPMSNSYDCLFRSRGSSEEADQQESLHKLLTSGGLSEENFRQHFAPLKANVIEAINELLTELGKMAELVSRAFTPTHSGKSDFLHRGAVYSQIFILCI